MRVLVARQMKRQRADEEYAEGKRRLLGWMRGLSLGNALPAALDTEPDAEMCWMDTLDEQPVLLSENESESESEGESRATRWIIHPAVLLALVAHAWTRYLRLWALVVYQDPAVVVYRVWRAWCGRRRVLPPGRDYAPSYTYWDRLHDSDVEME